MAAAKGFIKNVVDPLGMLDSGEMKVCFVTSGTSTVGYRVVHMLLDAGYKTVRVGVYKGPREFEVDKSVGESVFHEFEDKGATVITFDISNSYSYQMALAGVDTVFCTMPNIQGADTIFNEFVDACHKAEVKHFCKTSFYPVGKTPTDTTYSRFAPFAKRHQAWDDHLTKTKVDSRMTYTILGTSHLMSTPLVQQGPVLRKEGKYVTASFSMGVNYVSPNDVAKAVVAVLFNRKSHRNKCYNLTGAKPITDKKVAGLLSTFYGKEIEHVAIGYHDIEDEYKNRGIKKWLIKDMAGLEKVKASGYEEGSAAYTEDLETITGKKPESFDAYLKNKATMTIQENPEKSEEPAAKTEAPAAKKEEKAVETDKEAVETVLSSGEANEAKIEV